MQNFEAGNKLTVPVLSEYLNTTFNPFDIVRVAQMPYNFKVGTQLLGNRRIKEAMLNDICY
jgi:hypothetical protein